MLTLDGYRVGEYTSHVAEASEIVQTAANLVLETELKNPPSTILTDGESNKTSTGGRGDMVLPDNTGMNLANACRVVSITSYGSADSIAMTKPILWKEVPEPCRLEDAGHPSLTNQELAYVRHCLIRKQIEERLGGSVSIVAKSWSQSTKEFAETDEQGTYRKVQITLERSGHCR